MMIREIDWKLSERFDEDNNIRVRVTNLTITKKSDNEQKDRLRYVCITHTLDTDEWIKELREAGFDNIKTLYDYEEERKDNPERIQIIAQKPEG